MKKNQRKRTAKKQEELPPDPWEGIPCAEIIAILENGLREAHDPQLRSGRIFDPVNDLSVQSVFVTVARDKLRGMDFDEADLEDLGEFIGFEELIARYANGPLEPIVACSVTDGMVSGIWGLSEFRMENHGFIYYRPDGGSGDDESLPILGAWEPPTTCMRAKHAFFACTRANGKIVACPRRWASGQAERRGCFTPPSAGC